MDNRIDAASFRKMIEDESVSDDVVLEEMKKFSADKFDANGKFIAHTNEELKHIVILGSLARAVRPAMMERFRLYVVKKFGY